jgi:Mg2+/Co2+ transporter CorB
VSEGNGTYLVDGTTNIRELNRSQNWELPTDGPKTINGLILELLETIPEPGICLKIEGYSCEIVASNENRIRSVRIRPRDVAQADSD